MARDLGWAPRGPSAACVPASWQQSQWVLHFKGLVFLQADKHQLFVSSLLSLYIEGWLHLRFWGCTPSSSSLAAVDIASEGEIADVPASPTPTCLIEERATRDVWLPHEAFSAISL